MINLSAPTRSERVRGFQPPWRTVYVYKCQTCGKEIRVRAGSFRGSTPVPGVGAITCPHCCPGSSLRKPCTAYPTTGEIR